VSQCAAPILWNCKVETVIRSRFHPVRDTAIGAAGVLLFAWLAKLAAEAGPPAWDIAVRGVVHSYADQWLTRVMMAASWVGGGMVLWPLGVCIVLLLARAGREREGALFALAVVGANLISESMKLFFHRVRPEPWFGYRLPSSYSFPSGHAFVSFCFCLCLAEVVVRDEWPASRKAMVWCAAVACTLTIGLSRVYLGVHYPTDVLAGFAAGVVWTTVIRVAHYMWSKREA
jgi:undecaprenyl-diphosphatase